MRANPSFPFQVIALVLLGCGSTPPEPACVPGESIACVGAGGCTGFQVCNAAGTAYGACDCGGPTDAGPADAGALDAETPADASLDAETPIDAFVAPDAPVDGGPITGCDPLTHAECGAGQRCAWVYLTPESGETRCVLDGTLAADDACEPGPDGETGYDDCGRGLVCISNVCRPVCDLTTAGSCGADAHCLSYAGIFSSGSEPSTVGACAPTCDPLTGEPCAAGLGCYLTSFRPEATFACAGAGTTAVGADVAGPAFANSCVPGALAYTRPGEPARCLPFCRPVETHSGATDGAAGAAPYTCPELGGAASDACLFGWFFRSGGYESRLNELGLCVPDGFLTYDHDLMPGTAPIGLPSCTTLSNTDTDADGTPEHQEFGCAPLPAP